MHSLKNVLLGMVAVAILTACGSEKNEPEVITAPERPAIDQQPANPVAFVPGSFDRPHTLAVSSQAWFIADRSQGIIRIDQATGDPVVIAPYKANDESSLVESAAAMVLSADESLLYVLDTRAGQIVALNLANNEQEQILDRSDFDVADNFAWNAPTSLVLDTDGNRLLVGDRYGFFASSYYSLAIFSINLMDHSVSVVAENSVADNALQGFEARDFDYDAQQGHFYVTGLSQTSIGQYYYTAYRINESDWARKLLLVNANKAVSRNAAAHDIVYRAGEGIYLIDSSSGSVVNLDVSDDDASARTIRLSGDGNDYPLARPVALHFTGDQQFTVLDENLSALFAVDFTITVEQDDEGNETYESTSTRSLLASGKNVYPDPSAAPQVVFDMHFHELSGQLMITDSALTQGDLFTYDPLNDDPMNRYVVRQLDPQLDGIAFTEETYEVALKDGQSLEDITPNVADTPKAIFVADDSNGELIVYARGFFIEAKPAEVVTSDDDTKVAQFTYRRYPPGLWRVDAETFSATPISTRTNNDGEQVMVEVPFSSADILAMSAADKGIYFLPANPYSFGRFVVYYWNIEEQNFYQSAVQVASDIRGARPTSFTYDANTSAFLLSDPVNDALLSLDPEALTLKTVSGRTHDGDMFFSLPAGVATDNADTAYTFENSLKALVAVDIETGDRERLDSATNYIRSISKITLDRSNKKLYLLEKLSQRIITIDLDSLEQQWLD